MFSHATLGTNDFDRALRFWSAVMSVLGHEPRFVDAARPWAGWQPAGAGVRFSC
ncbi:VOC family protein [Paragemmobacter aquarius]|uniref:hypothetical protein n=1 Tax=Paragemmobacter aquarius TaxID=2169400 RepID=UPI001E2FF340|nr:hypothetical protein [Gemmobacter aquarius]